MKLSILQGCCGGGGGSSKCVGGKRTGVTRTRSSGSKADRNLAIMGSIVLLLICSFVGICGGKPFHMGGQAELEEDTTQGSLKEKFPLSVSSGGHSLIDDSLLDNGNGYGEDNEYDTILIGNGGLIPIGGGAIGASQPEDFRDYTAHRHFKRHPVGNYGPVVHKRSSIGGRSSSSPYSFDDGGGDEEFHRVQRYNNHNTNNLNNRPGVYEQSGAVGVGSDVASPSSAESNVRIRQKLMNLRNQYGDKWMSYVGPYAYRKRQILYRQCFFNPISCF